MQLKTFSARSTAAVLAQIKEELGPDAIILDSREEGGMFCMTAARERSETEPEAVRDSVTAAGRPVPSAVPVSSSGPALDDTFLLQMQSMNGQQWQEEWSCIRGHLLALMKPSLKLEELPPRQRVALDFLQREGVNDSVLLDIVSHLKKRPDASILEPLGAMVLIQPWTVRDWPQPIQLVAGPFGAGKTTVAIRLALASAKEAPDTRVCVINADASRGNGRLLLRHYSELSDFTYKEASSTMELVSCLDGALKEGFTRIIVDLPGLSRGSLLSSLLKSAGLDGQARGIGARAAVHLVFPPHYNETQLQAMLERYRPSIPGSMIWTKLDEAEHFGQIINVAHGTGLPVSALSYGPSLGNSLAPAGEQTLWRLIFKKELP